MGCYSTLRPFILRSVASKKRQGALVHSATGEDVDGATGEPTLADNIRSWGPEHDEGGLKGGEEHVLVFEDGIFGVKAGIAAGMKVIWVPDSNLKKISLPGQELGADQVLDSLEAFVPEEWGLPPFEGED